MLASLPSPCPAVHQSESLTAALVQDGSRMPAHLLVHRAVWVHSTLMCEYARGPGQQVVRPERCWRACLGVTHCKSV